MAGSYSHATTNDGRLLRNEDFVQMIENLGDAYEMAEEMYGMIWFLAEGNAGAVAQAKQYWETGFRQMSPGRD